MDIIATRDYCLSKLGATEDIKWEHHLCFSVGGKMFLLTSPDEVPCNASFKVTEEDFDDLIDQDGFTTAPHLAKKKWIRVADIEMVPDKIWKRLIDSSYEQVFNKLTKKLQKEIIENGF